MSDSTLPIAVSSGRRLIIEDVTDTASFSARRLSFNAKEIQFLCDELARWLAEMYEEDVDPDLSHSLMSGVVLLSIVEQYLPQIKLNKWHKNASPISFQARDNINIFANVCVELGMRRSDVCNFSNFEKGDLKQITATLCAFAKLGVPKGLNKVSEDLKVYVDQAYSVPVNLLEIVDETKPTEEELAQMEREKQEALERQQKIEALTKDIEKDRDDFLDAYNRAINILCQDFAELSDLDLSDSDLESDSESDSSEKSIKLSDSEPEERKQSVSERTKNKEEYVHAAKKEVESADDILFAMKQKRESLEEEDGDVTAILSTEKDLENKLAQLKEMIQKEEEEMERLKREEEERLKRKEEEERLKREEEERLKREEEERLKREEEERLKREEEERLKREEEERLRREEEERLKREEEERIRIVEEEKRKREEEEAERKRQEEERKRQEEEAEQKRLEEEKQKLEEEKRKQQEENEQKMKELNNLVQELERQFEEEEERKRREEEEEAKKKCRCRNKRPKEEENDEMSALEQELKQAQKELDTLRTHFPDIEVRDEKEIVQELDEYVEERMKQEQNENKDHVDTIEEQRETEPNSQE